MLVVSLVDKKITGDIMGNGKKTFQVWNEISSLLVALGAIALGSILITGAWIFPKLPALFSTIVGYVIAIVGAVSLLGSIANFFLIGKRK